jgi:16S rRNA (cytidine1402-2'-O)-methyltransferase
MNRASGTLFVVATPIGNLGDLSERARQVLADAAMVAAEDTRRTGQLLTAVNLRTRLVSLHEHNETARIEEVVAKLEAGGDVALVSDAGTPLISDPGYRLLAELRKRGLPASPIPGPSAITALLSVAGLPTDRFRFEGFLPSRAAARRERLALLASAEETLVVFESVHRIRDSLADVIEAFGAERPVALGRELTKRHETLYRGSVAEVLAAVTADSGGDRGEFTLAIAGANRAPDVESGEVRRIFELLRAELPPGKSAALTARITGLPRRDVYRLASLSGED